MAQIHLEREKGKSYCSVTIHMVAVDKEKGAEGDDRRGDQKQKKNEGELSKASKNQLAIVEGG